MINKLSKTTLITLLFLAGSTAVQAANVGDPCPSISTIRSELASKQSLVKIDHQTEVGGFIVKFDSMLGTTSNWSFVVWILGPAKKEQAWEKMISYVDKIPEKDRYIGRNNYFQEGMIGCGYSIGDIGDMAYEVDAFPK